MSVETDRPIISCASAAEWESWLEDQHASSNGVWLRIAKRDTGIPSVSYLEALDEALCYGWIDGQKSKLDDVSWLQRFTPRQRRSRWSKINRARATELIAAGRMKPSGLREVERAKADGRWDAAYDAQATATVPDDLRRELEKNPDALAFFAALDSRNRYAILHRIQAAKQPETRARRVATFVAMLSQHQKIYP